MPAIPYVVTGCGGHGIHHIQSAVGLNFVLAGVFDPQRQRAQAAVAAAGNPGAVICDSEEQLLSLPGVEALVITSLDRLHADTLDRAIQAGLHVLVDKPIAANFKQLKTARRALSQAALRGQVVTSCHPRHRDGPYEYVTTNLPLWQRKYGQLSDILLDFSYHHPDEDWKTDRSLLLDHFGHEIGILRRWVGNLPFRASRLIDHYDQYAVAGVFGNSVTFHCTGTRRLGVKEYPEYIRLRFAQAHLTINTETGAVQVEPHISRAVTTGEPDCPPTQHNQRLRMVMHDFAQSIRDPRHRNYLTAQDLVVNTESSLALVHDGHYVYNQ